MTSPVLLSTTQHDSDATETDNLALDLLSDTLAKFSVTRRGFDRSRYCVERTRRGLKKRPNHPRRSPINHKRYTKRSLPEQKTVASSHNEAIRDAYYCNHTATCQGAEMEAGETGGEPPVPVDYIDLTDESKSLETIFKESVTVYVQAWWFPART